MENKGKFSAVRILSVIIAIAVLGCLIPEIRNFIKHIGYLANFKYWGAGYLSYITIILTDIAAIAGPVAALVFVLMQRHRIAAFALAIQYTVLGICSLIWLINFFFRFGQGTFSACLHWYGGTIITVIYDLLIAVLLLLTVCKKVPATVTVIVSFLVRVIAIVILPFIGLFISSGFEMFAAPMVVVTGVLCLLIFEEVNEKRISVLIGDSPDTDEYSESIVMCIILSIASFGLYWIIWLAGLVYKVHKLHGDTRSPLTEVILILLIPFYSCYWMYKNGKQVCEDSKRYGVNIPDKSVGCMLLAFFGLSMIACALIQSDFNILALQKRKPEQVVSPIVTKEAEPTSVTAALEELKKMKEASLITEEEYAQKRKEILDRL